MSSYNPFAWEDGKPSVFMSDPHFFRKSCAPKAPQPPITFSKVQKNATAKLIHELRPKAGR